MENLRWCPAQEILNVTSIKVKIITHPHVGITLAQTVRLKEVHPCFHQVAFREWIYVGLFICNCGLNIFPDELKSPLQLSNTEVCYTLHGEFRGGSLVMRGCDAMPINQLDMDSNTTERCFDWSVKLWFETEVGIEYINRTRLCICNTDYCNFEGDQGGSVTRKPFVGLLTVFVVILGYFVI